MPSKTTSGFACMDCGHKFRTLKAAERAAYGNSGCPKCGSTDIDLAPVTPEPKAEAAYRVEVLRRVSGFIESWVVGWNNQTLERAESLRRAVERQGRTARVLHASEY